MSENNAQPGEARDSQPAADAAAEKSQNPGTDAPPDAADDVEALRAQAEENWSRYLRAVAELDNLRKRSARELESARKFGAERLVSAILPVRDSLEAGLKAAGEAAQDTLDIATLLEGEQATLRLLDQALTATGISEIDPLGEPFDPERHEAMSMQPSATAEPNSVLAVVQKGYALHERVVRPARVIVAQAPPAAMPESGPDSESGS